MLHNSVFTTSTVRHHWSSNEQRHLWTHYAGTILPHQGSFLHLYLLGYLTNDSTASGLGPHTTAPATASCSFKPQFQILMGLVELGHTLLHQAGQGVLSCHCNVVPELLE